MGLLMPSAPIGEEAAHGRFRTCALVSRRRGRSVQLLSPRPLLYGSADRPCRRMPMRAVVCRELRRTRRPGAGRTADAGARRLRRADPGPRGRRQLRRQPDARAAATRRSRRCPSPRASSSPARSRPWAPACAAWSRASACWPWSATAPSPSRPWRAPTTWCSLPDDMDDVTAAGFAIAYGTAHGALRWRADLHAGETLARAWRRRRRRADRGRVRQGASGATVIATARGAEKLAVARAHGADHAARQRRPRHQGARCAS